MALSQAERARLTRRYQTLLAGIAERTVRPVDAAWDALDGFRDDDIPGFVEATRPATTAAKAAAVAVAVGYLSSILSTRPVAVRPNEVDVAFNAESAFIAVRKALSEGLDFVDARSVGKSQAQAAVRNLTISTARTTGDVFNTKTPTRIVGWERNAESKACPWCRNLDGTVFSSASAGDFGHDRCNCTVSPLAA